MSAYCESLLAACWLDVNLSVISVNTGIIVDRTVRPIGLVIRGHNCRPVNPLSALLIQHRTGQLSSQNEVILVNPLSALSVQHQMGQFNSQNVVILVHPF